jgi:hypothetical protein
MNEIGLEGYEKPNRAQTEKTRNIEAKTKNVHFETRTSEERKRSESVVNSTRKRGERTSRDTTNGELPLGLMIMSKGSSKIIGAAAVPTKALVKDDFKPWCLVI